PPGSTLLPYTTLFRSAVRLGDERLAAPRAAEPVRVSAVRTASARGLAGDDGHPADRILGQRRRGVAGTGAPVARLPGSVVVLLADRKSTRLNSSHGSI